MRFRSGTPSSLTPSVPLVPLAGGGHLGLISSRSVQGTVSHCPGTSALSTAKQRVALTSCDILVERRRLTYVAAWFELRILSKGGEEDG